MSLIKQRISFVDIEVIIFSVILHEKKYKIRGIKTCYGDVLMYATSYSMLLTASEETPACQHFNKVYKRCLQLHHNNVELCDHLEVICLPLPTPYPLLPTPYPPPKYPA